MARVELTWNPSEPTDPGPCIEVVITNSRDVIEAGLANGLEFPAPVRMKALLDTGAGVTVISKVFANHCKLFQTSDSVEITALGASHMCGEHAGSISFPGTELRAIETTRIISAVFAEATSLCVSNWTRHSAQLEYQL